MAGSSPLSRLARLVLFMICLAVAASCIAGVHYAAVDHPAQNVVQAPENSYGYGPDGNQPVFLFTPSIY